MITAERFWVKVAKSNGCWEWTGATHKGYGWFNRGDKSMLAHRYSWELWAGALPTDLCVCHHCDNRLCVRPDHLFLGTRADNNEDMWRKGRTARGERVKGAKLTEEQVTEIRSLYRAGDYSQRQLGEMYGVTQTNVQAIVSGRSWGGA